MPLRFNQLLVEEGIDPADVRLLRHQTNLGGGRSLIEAWRTDRIAFEDYQARQLTAKRSSFMRPYWAAFLGTWDGRTLFAGLYAASEPVLIDEPIEVPLTGTIAPPGTVDRFTTTLAEPLGDYAGRLYIEWGGGSSGKRSWNQRADVQDKVITELHLDQTERPFPDVMAIASPLSVIGEAPPG